MIGPDGYIGGVMAIQGIRDATVLLHGQNGCRNALLPSLGRMPRNMGADSVDNPTYRGIAGIPYSGIAAPDYTGGSQRQYDRAIGHVSREDYSLVVSMCSPGASILGDDLADDGGRLMAMDLDALGDDAPTGFDKAMAAVLERIGPSEEGIVPGTISLLGLSIMHKDWRAVDHELRHILGHSGAQVVCTVGAGCTIDELRRSLSSEYCVVLTPEYCRDTAEVYRRRGCTVVSTGVSPVGFDAVSGLHDAIRDAVGDPMPGAGNMLNAARSRAYSAVRASGRDMTGTSFRVDSVPSVKEPLTAWLEESFGMVEDDDPDILFADGNTAAMSERAGICRKGVDIGFPSSRPDGFVSRPVLGMDGALYLLDETFSCPSDSLDGRPGYRPLRRVLVEHAVAEHLGEVVPAADGLVGEARQRAELPVPHDEAAVGTEMLAGDQVDVVRHEDALRRAALDDVPHDPLGGPVVEQVVEVVEVDQGVPVAGLGDPREQAAHDGHPAGNAAEEGHHAIADDHDQPAIPDVDIQWHAALVAHERLEIPLQVVLRDVFRDLHVIVHLTDMVVHLPHRQIVQRVPGEVHHRTCRRVIVDQILLIECPQKSRGPVQERCVRSPSDTDALKIEDRGGHVGEVVVEDRGTVDGHPLGPHCERRRLRVLVDDDGPAVGELVVEGGDIGVAVAVDEALLGVLADVAGEARHRGHDVHQGVSEAGLAGTVLAYDDDLLQEIPADALLAECVVALVGEVYLGPPAEAPVVLDPEPDQHA